MLGSPVPLRSLRKDKEITVLFLQKPAEEQMLSLHRIVRGGNKWALRNLKTRWEHFSRTFFRGTTSEVEPDHTGRSAA